jgi:nicotinamide phosphoribosyltransferase
VIEILMDKFGFTVNSKGFKVLPPYIRLIQGDGINEASLPRIIDNMIAKGFSIDNIAFGMGGGLLQAWNRDTLKYAMKASARLDTAGVWHDVFKDPISDHGKLSKKGRLGLIEAGGIGPTRIITVPKHVADNGNLLRKVYLNGELLVEDTFVNIRARAAMKESEYVFEVVERY